MEGGLCEECEDSTEKERSRGEKWGIHVQTEASLDHEILLGFGISDLVEGQALLRSYRLRGRWSARL